MGNSVEVFESVAGAMASVGDMNDAGNKADFIVAANQAVATFTAIATNPATAGFVIATNASAAATSIGKILSDLQRTGKPDWSDFASVAGNVATVAAAAVIAGHPGGRIAGVAARIARGVGIIGTSHYFIDKAHAQNIGPNSNVNQHFRDAITPPRRDPLAIDLDRDGIETVSVTSSSPILFDHNADGIKTGTGWLKGDDAWLVLDRNNNGTIDSGRELFGVDTAITVNGVQRNATSGFEALRSLDTGNGTAGSAGHGDLVFDANDAAFTQVRLWQDLNQDGISQANELSTLADKGIASISLALGMNVRVEIKTNKTRKVNCLFSRA